MKRKYKLGDRVRILWDKTVYTVSSDYTDIGTVRGYFQAFDGTHLVELYKFHKRDKYHNLHFPIHTVRPLREFVRDGDTL